MTTSRLLKDEINYIIFNEIYFRFTQPKAKRKAFTILETCVRCLSRKSFEEVTLQIIATEAGVSRPLIKYYFTDLASLLETVVKYIRLKFQNYVFLTKASNRSASDQKHIASVMRMNTKMAKIEIIKEHFHRVFDAPTIDDARIMLAEIYQWSFDSKAGNIFRWVVNLLKDNRFWNYFDHRYTSGVIEGINRAIKGLKWQAYGYKNMFYFALKIMQKVGYLNHKFALNWTMEPSPT